MNHRNRESNPRFGSHYSTNTSMTRLKNKNLNNKLCSEHNPITDTETKGIQLNLPSGTQPQLAGDSESMEVINAEAVAVWKGCIVSKQTLSSAGHLHSTPKFSNISFIFVCSPELSISMIAFSRNWIKCYSFLILT